MPQKRLPFMVSGYLNIMLDEQAFDISIHIFVQSMIKFLCDQIVSGQFFIHFFYRQDNLPDLLLSLQGLSGNAPEYVKGGLNIWRQGLVEQSMDPVQQPLQL